MNRPLKAPSRAGTHTSIIRELRPDTQGEFCLLQGFAAGLY